MRLCNTLTRQKQEFKPIKKGRVLMYHCGPTVYWTQHIGNMRAMVLADLIVRTFKYLGYHVKLVRNYTDVGHLTSDSDEGEDKIEKSAREEKSSPQKITEKYIKIFEQDTKALNILEPVHKPRATRCIKEMIEMVKILLKKDYAYTTDLAIYFDVSKVKDYTKLSGQNMADKMKEAGKAEITDPNKRQPSDFALWFFKAGAHKNAMQYWPSPFQSPLVKNGEGFPGWHLECSVMAKKFLGETIDIHMGGVEHIPIHHTNEIAQSEAANGLEFVHYWLHNEHLLVNNDKMSKSAGTGYSLQEVLDKGFEPLALRYFFLQAHYRSKQNFTWQALEGAQSTLNKLREFFKYPFSLPEPSLPRNDKNTCLAGRQARIQEYKKKFVDFISDDFNVPQALAVVWDMVKSVLDYQDKKKLILDFDKVLGLGLAKIKKEKIKIPEEVKRLVKQRELARENKDWIKADELRKKIYELGFTVEDTGGGSVVRKK